MRVMVFDTETLGLTSNPVVFNIGFVVVDTVTKEILYAYERLIEETYKKGIDPDTNKYAKRIGAIEYFQELAKNQENISTKEQIFADIETVLKAFQIDECYAFNDLFDQRAIKGTFGKIWNANFSDIRKSAMDTICKTQDYKDFCQKHNLLTKRKNSSTTVQAILNYLTQSMDVQERHTALSDAVQEAQILMVTLNWES